MADPADIDRLIEEGLNHYGAGDLDGALLSWERALAIDPDNAQANSYVDYVRDNYEALGADQAPGVSDADETGVPFGIEDEPEYLIEVVAGELPAQSSPPLYMDPLDEGWFFAEDNASADPAVPRVRSREASVVPPVLELELEADEPPPPEISFDDATREYMGGSGKPPADLIDDDGFKSEPTPVGWNHQETEIRKRDLGFVQPVDRAGRAPAVERIAAPPVAEPRPAEPRPASAEFGVRLRTPTQPPRPVAVKPEVGGPSAVGALESIDDAQRGAIQAAADDLIAGMSAARGSAFRTPRGGSAIAPREPGRIATRDLPGQGRVPAQTQNDDDDGMQLETGEPTVRQRLLDIDPPPPPAPQPPAAAEQPATSATPTRDMMIAAPTRELGLRPSGRPASVYPDEDLPTTQSDARAIRSSQRDITLDAALDGGTRHDLVLPFDPIDARSAQILDELDGEGPPNESKEDRVRRRITSLLDRALAWNGLQELDKAVTAVDLALSEDPNSALAQKLIHRNRDTIMQVFQSFLGDLERQPQLARPLHELANAPISPRAAFLLSRIDGMLSIDEILDVSGMPRLEAYRHLCQLFLRGILR